MASDAIAIPYNQDLKRLEKLLAGVQRAGDFFVEGSLETPMPRVEIDGVGVLSFPVPSLQIQDVIKQADRAPYGRGGETILDTSVRNAWQLAPPHVHIAGKSWEKAFQQVISTVIAGLGCSGMDVSADLYKLLVYEEGGFFLSHRDAEKAGGMFGTLVIVLPSAHRGGELIIRHGEREVTVELCSPEISELTFAAFYADCEHEVRPITHGNRVCLIYNLIQGRRGTQHVPLTAPLYESEVRAAATLLEEAFQKSGAPAKLAWLLEHQYSPAGLSFAGVKGEDAARTQVLRQAGERAGCSVHLGIVHIAESGPAEPRFDPYEAWRSRRGYSRRDGYDEERNEEEDEHAANDEFDVIEVSDAWHYVDHWVDLQDRPVDFGKLPLNEGELLPAGALDDDPPDEQRLMEATGNEGASFERSYHRAALVLWPRSRFADVLLQAGVGAAMPYLKELVQGCCNPSASREEREAALSTARQIVAAWERDMTNPIGLILDREPSRSEMIVLLGQLADPVLLEDFVNRIVTRQYDGSENEALAASMLVLGASKAGELFSKLARERMRSFRGECVNFLSRLVHAQDPRPTAAWMHALRDIGAAVVEALPRGKERTLSSHLDRGFGRAQRAKPADVEMLVSLLDSLAALDAPRLRNAACEAVANARVFDPATVIVPGLEIVHARDGESFRTDADCLRLWRHAAEVLLARSEHPPEPPRDWRQDAKVACTCADCRELQTFALDPLERTHRFRVRKDRRQHLHQQIERHSLDMTHVTERRGSPQMLVCTKTRRTYERQCRRHSGDLASMSTLLRVMGEARGERAMLSARMAAATRSESG